MVLGFQKIVASIYINAIAFWFDEAGKLSAYLVCEGPPWQYHCIKLGIRSSC